MNYNDEEVEFCNACKSLWVVEDEFKNVWCKKCDSLNHTSTLPNIEEYKKAFNIKN